MNNKQLRKQKKAAARAQREEQQGRRVIFWLAGVMLVLALAIIGVGILL